MHNFNKIKSGHVCPSTLLKFYKYQEDNIRPKAGGKKKINYNPLHDLGKEILT
jgi:hypothetical protein